MSKPNAVIRPALGFVLINLSEAVRGVLGFNGIEFNADHDTVAEHAAMANRPDLLPFLEHEEETTDNEGNPKTVLVKYTPQGRRVEIEPEPVEPSEAVPEPESAPAAPPEAPPSDPEPAPAEETPAAGPAPDPAPAEKPAPKSKK